ncbi:MAG: hypothetical protein QOD99_2119, partial [Chthoniobacter sp.]|nr:hypothetical protein [Chthoniobacter sp.]
EFADVEVTDGAKTIVKEGFGKSAEGWVAESGTWKTSEGAYVQSAGDQPALSRLVFPTDKSVCTLTMRVKKTGGDEGFLVGFGTANAGDYYWWNLGGWGNHQHGVESVVGGTKVLIGQQVPGTIELNRWYKIKIETDGRRIKCYLDNALVHDFPQPDFDDKTSIAASCVKDGKSGDLILKIVNTGSSAQPSQVDISSSEPIDPDATRTILTGDPKATNTYSGTRNVMPTRSNSTVGKSFTYEAPSHSFTVFRMKTR